MHCTFSLVQWNTSLFFIKICKTVLFYIFCQYGPCWILSPHIYNKHMYVSKYLFLIELEDNILLYFCCKTFLCIRCLHLFPPRCSNYLKHFLRHFCFHSFVVTDQVYVPEFKCRLYDMHSCALFLPSLLTAAVQCFQCPLLPKLNTNFPSHTYS